MAKVTKAGGATEDLNEIWEYIAQSSPEQADKFLDLILDKCELLAKFPEMGLARHEYLIDLRGFPVKSYIIFYQQIEDGIEVLRVVHGSRDVPQIFDDFFDNLESEN